MITNVKLKNWRSHLESEFKFSTGVNTILGIMGSGKSSVLDGICFALFGTFPALNQRKVKIDGIIRNKPNQAKEASVEVEFLKNKEVYSVKRKIKYGKGTSDAEFRKNGELLEAENSQAVTEYVCKILQTSYDVFSRAVYSEQNNIDEFLTMPKGRRMEKIDNLLQIDKFESARKKVTTVTNRIEQEIESKEDTLTDVFTDEDKRHKKEIKKETEKLSKDIDSLSKKLSEIEEKKKQLTEKVKQLNEAENSLKEFQSKKDSFLGKKEQITETLEQYGPITISKEAAQNKLGEVQKELDELKIKKEKISELKQSIASLKSKKEVLGEDIKKIEEELDSYNFNKSSEELKNLTISGLLELLLKEDPKETSPENKIEKLKNEISKNEKNLERFLTKQEYSRHILFELEKGDLCPTCKTEIRNKRKEEIISEHKTEIEDIEQRKKDIKKDLVQLKDSLRKEEDRLETKKEERAELKTTAKILVEKIETRTSNLEKIKELSEKIKKTEKEIKEKTPEKDENELRNQLEKFKVIIEHYSFKEKITELKKHIKNIDKQIVEKKKIIENLSEKEKEFNKLSAEEQGLKSSLDGLKNLLSEKNKRLKELTEKEEFFEKIKEKIKQMKDTKSQLKIFKTALKSTQESLREEFVSNVNMVMVEIWTTLYPYQDLDSVKLIIENRDYVLKVHTRNGWTEVEGVASGGERTLAALALKIAFSLALAPNLSWLILDEPTHNLDTHAIEELSEVLTEQLPELINQIFLITHEQRLESAVSGYLYRLERNKEKDEPTRVELISEPEIRNVY